MFERFSSRARLVLILSQKEARQLGHVDIATEHLLLALLRQPGSAAAQVLDTLGMHLDDVRVDVERIAGRGSGTPSDHMPFTPGARRVLELSVREASTLGSDGVGTEHVLLGLVSEGSGVGAQVLTELCGDLWTVRGRVYEWLAQHGGDPDDADGRPAPPELELTVAASAGDELREIRRTLAEIRQDILDLRTMIESRNKGPNESA